MSHNNQKKIAVINDFTGFGKCSISVSLPIISALKIQCCPLPTAILSNHTAYKEYFFDDYTEKMNQYIDNWKKLNLCFEGISTGFLGSEKQIEIVLQFIRDFNLQDTILIVDPVMGDDGRAYETYTNSMCERMKELIKDANIVTPNLTEACILAGIPYNEKLKNQEIVNMAAKISDMGPSKVVITGIDREKYISNYVFEKDKISTFVRTKKVGCQRSGTGDIFSAIISADAVNKVDFLESVKKAVHFIGMTLKISEERNIPKEDGVCFEDVLFKLK